jgi:tetratricopeptide (TPR) repeat protein/O-antigen ligase
LRIPDRIFQAVLLGLILFAPLAFGSVYPWAYRIVEAGCFGLAALWMLKLHALAGVGEPPPPEAGLTRSLGLPLGLLLGFIAFQTLPLPPVVLEAISPATYSQYRRIFSDWPARAPGAELVSIKESKTSAAPNLSAGEAKPPVSSSPAVPAIYSTRWRPLTIAWPLTTTGLIGAFAVAALLLAVALYPAGPPGEWRASEQLARVALRAVLASGPIIALVGLIQWATWNGKILWTLVPLDWGAPVPSAQRASGPFVNPDHFAGYLAMVFPLMLSGAVFGGFPASSKPDPARRILCGVAAFLIFIAVALSESRAGWMGLALGTIVLFLFAQSRAQSADSGGNRATARSLRASLAILAAMVLLALMFVGGRGREESAARFGVTVAQGSQDLGQRLAIWLKTPSILREFPLFGVGFGAWPEIFFRFLPAPRPPLFDNAAHNDYLELLVDVGLVGSALAGWLVVRVAARLRSALRTVSERMLPALAAIIAGLIAMAAIEFFDFDLQIPANLVLFVVLAALALRMSIYVEQPETGPRLVRASESDPNARIFYAPLAGAIGLAIVALTQAGRPYPHDIAAPASLNDARNLLLRYPYHPDTHRRILVRFGDLMDQAMMSRWISTWEWLDPTDPRAHDVYAQDLIDHGRQADAMAQIAESVFVAPLASQHLYLSPQILARLPDDEKRAINDGLVRAVSAGFSGSVETLGDFYAAVGKPEERASLFARAAEQENDPTRRARDLRYAADAYLEMGRREKAAEVLRSAIDADPAEADDYTDLIARVLVPREEFEQVQSVIADGIDRGADPCRLALSAVKGAQALGRYDVAEQALDTALKADSTAYECTVALGGLYLASGRNARAVLLYDKAAELRPDSAEAYIGLAIAADRNYDYSKAEAAYNRAASLAPENRDIAERLAGFKRKLAESAADSDHSQAISAAVAAPDAHATAATDSDPR